ncbi:hypothetical protein SAMN05444144_103277 [Flavobacterium akiainvivens]|nr:hypothetical protein SAMN05444144_103277 [Flavobacterium akiainvivens]
MPHALRGAFVIISKQSFQAAFIFPNIYGTCSPVGFWFGASALVDIIVSPSF